MVAHMKTTIDIADGLFREAKDTARDDGVTLRELVEEGLRAAIERRRRRGGFSLREASVDGNGLRPEVAEGGWSRIREMIYEGRGA